MKTKGTTKHPVLKHCNNSNARTHADDDARTDEQMYTKSTWERGKPSVKGKTQQKKLKKNITGT